MKKVVVTMYKRFDEMMKKLSPTLRGIAHRMNGHFTFFTDDDLYQEALAHLWASFGRGALRDKTDSYILQGCYFYLKNYLRTSLDKAKLVSLSELIDGQDVSIEESLASKDTNARDDLDAGLLAENIVFKSLDARERLVLRYSTEGLTIREIGKRLGVSHVMVVKIRSKIRKKCDALRRGGHHG